MAAKLTDIQIRHWLKAGQPVAKAQGEVPGLTFTLSANGAAAWVLRYRHGGKQRELTLGRYPDYSIVAAKAAALEARAKVQTGIDVAREKRQSLRTRAADQSFRALCLDYTTKVLPSLADSTRVQRAYHINGWLIPRLGSLQAKDVNAADIIELVQAMATGSYTQARSLLHTASGVFDHGMAQAILTGNPCKTITAKAVLGPAPAVKARIQLTQAELRTLLPALSGRLGVIVKLLLLTAVRVNELLRAEWQHIDFDRAHWTIPAGHSKTGKTFTVPLAPSAVALFRQLEVWACGSRFVLPGQADNTLTPAAVQTGIVRLVKTLPAVRRFSPHDLRSTCRSHLSALGVPLLVAERCLNHSLGGMVAVYDQHDYLSERRAALTRWADFLDCCESGRPWGSDNVVLLRKAV